MDNDVMTCVKKRAGSLNAIRNSAFSLRYHVRHPVADVLLEAEPDHMAADVHFRLDNCLLGEDRYRAVALQKRAPLG
jgi:hypothetical protein